MADGRKHEDVKIIKNPLLSQSFRLEELSGVSFIVPPPKSSQPVEVYGSKSGVDVPPLGEKKPGSQVGQEGGGLKDVPHSSQSFTDVPLNISDLKIGSNDKPISSPTQGAIPSKKEGEPSPSTKPSTSSFLPFLGGFVSSFKSPENVKEEIDPTTVCNVPQGPTKHQPSPLTIIEPQLISPTSDSKPNLTELTSSSKTTLQTDTNNTPAFVQTKPSENPISEPPKVSFPLPPPPSAQHNSSLRNPYALRNIHSSAHRLSKSPPSLLATSDSVPLYSQSNNPISSNFFGFLSGPQVATPASSESIPAATIPSFPSYPTFPSKEEEKIQSTTSEVKPNIQLQNIGNEQKNIPVTPFAPNVFPSQEAFSYSQSIFPVKTLNDINTVHNISISEPSIPQNPSGIPIQEIIPHPDSKEQNTKVDFGTASRFSEPTVSNVSSNVSLGKSVYTVQDTLLETSNQGLSNIATVPQTEEQNTDNKPPIQDSTNILTISDKHSEPNIQTIPLNTVFSTTLSSSSEFQNEPKDLYNHEQKDYQDHFSGMGVSTSGKAEQNNSDGSLPTSNRPLLEQSKTEEKTDSVGFQSKQVTSDNIPSQEFQKVESDIASGDVFSVGNTSYFNQTDKKDLSKPQGLSGYFLPFQTNANQPSENIIHSVPSAPITHSAPHSVSDLLPPPSTHHSQSSSLHQNPMFSADTTYQSISNPPTHGHSENKTQITVGSSTMVQGTVKTVDPATVYMIPKQEPNLSVDPTSLSSAVTNPPPTYLSASNLHPAPPIPSNTASLYPQPLYTFPKLVSDPMSNSFPKQQHTQTFPSVVDKIEPNPANTLIPTFNYFSSPQTSCLPPSLDQPVQKPAATSGTPPSSYYFRPIQKPDAASNPYSFHSSVSTNNETSHQVFNPTPSAPPNAFNFPPPNVCYPKETPSTLKQQTTHTEVAPPPLHNTDNQKSLEGEELDQIPLEGSAVPLFNPETLARKKSAEVTAAGNTFRISGGIKKRTYAPVPDLGVTERRNFIPPTSPSGMSASSLEEMSAIHENQNQNSVGSPKAKTPESPLVVENYYANSHGTIYRPPYQHWFFKCGRDKKSPWTPFSMADSLNLEQVFTSSELQEDTKVSTDGGRYDVELLKRKKMSVYWDEPDGEVRRCSWFVKSISDARYVPYDENIAALLEDEYKQGCETNEWNRKVELADGEVIILHGPSAIAHHVRSSSPDAWGNQPPLQQKPRVVKRGVEEFDIPKGEPKQVDHLLLVVHGIGKACDLRFRSLVEVVDDFRSISLQLVQSHFHSGVQNGMVGRVEVLPVEWHKALHTETIDDRLSAITLPSIPRAREFTNETLLDILFYTSPVFCEKIVQAVGAELNRVYTLYQKRNPGFRGQVSLGAHSLGSLILFDMLCHQQPIQKPHILSTQASLNEDEEDLDENMDEVGCLMRKAKLSRRMSYLTMGPGTGQPYTIYPQLLFQPKAFFALGSPIGMFVTVRGVEALGEDFRFPTCRAFFNIFHPNDPVAYRIEALIKPEMAKVPAVLIPHHKGRKRMHLELKETMAHVTAALKQKLVDSMRNTWNAVFQLAMFNRKDHNLQGEVNKVIEDEVLREASYLESDPPIGIIGEECNGSELRVGKLNDGRRIDYVLQEAPLETFNQYISAIRSHLVYWESEDTMLLILKEIYGQMGITPDSQVPQPILPFDISGDSETYSEYTYTIGALPTQFVRK